jgi:hypothetical protein
MTGSDYRKEMIDIKSREKRLENQINFRVLELVMKFPEAIIERIHNTDIKASSLNSSYLDAQSTEKKIHYIEVIEKWCSNQSKFKQGDLFE